MRQFIIQKCDLLTIEMGIMCGMPYGDGNVGGGNAVECIF